MRPTDQWDWMEDMPIDRSLTTTTRTRVSRVQVVHSFQVKSWNVLQKAIHLNDLSLYPYVC